MDGPQTGIIRNASSPHNSANDNPSASPEFKTFVDTADWLAKIGKAKFKEQVWRDRAKKCIRFYRNDNNLSRNRTEVDTSTDKTNIFNILFSNTETLLPALFSNIPKPDIRNRFLTQNHVAEQAGRVLERNISYGLEKSNFFSEVTASVKDYLLTGRGIIRVRLINEEEPLQVSELSVNDNEETESVVGDYEEIDTVIKKNSVVFELVEWDSIVFEPVKRWKDVSWIDFQHMLTKDEFEDLFPGAPLIDAVQSKEQNTQFVNEPYYRVHEIWDKKNKRVIYIGSGDKPLKVVPDPYGLEHFFPIPYPLYSIVTNDTLVPVPEFKIYEEQSRELNQISFRIVDLIRSTKFIGIYDSKEGKVNDMLQAYDSQFVPVSPNVMRQGGIKSIIDMLDVSPMANVLIQLYRERDQIKQIIYEVTGISDIVRGSSVASETATAQNIKSNYAGLRLKNRRETINHFIVELLRMQAEMITKFYTIDQMSEISGIEITPEMETLLRNEMLQNYKIEIETDSTIQADMDAEAAKRADIMRQVFQAIQTIAPLVKQGDIPLEAAKALIKWPLLATKISREVEDAIDMIGIPDQQNPAPGPMGPPEMPPGLPPQESMGNPTPTPQMFEAPNYNNPI